VNALRERVRAVRHPPLPRPRRDSLAATKTVEAATGWECRSDWGFAIETLAVDVALSCPGPNYETNLSPNYGFPTRVGCGFENSIRKKNRTSGELCKI
jgi:hypothetical protein